MTTLTPSPTAAPIVLTGLGQVTDRVLRHRTDLPASEWLNSAGGDVGCTGASRSLTRHSANYRLASELALRGGLPPGPVVDVGCGVGGHSAWLAEVLERPLWLVEPDPDARTAAAGANPDAEVFGSVGEVPAGSGALVAAMEVIEHLPFADQPAFVDDLARITVPGGSICLSTPDESSYLGGRSHYAPHLGALGWTALAQLFADRPGPSTLWRLDGEPFQMGRAERIAVPALNRAHTLLDRHLPRLVRAAAPIAVGTARAVGRTRQHRFEHTTVWAADDPLGSGTGLFVQHRP